MPNFFQLINEIEVKEGTKITHNGAILTYKYNQWENQHGLSVPQIPHHALEQGWELVKMEPKKLKAKEAWRHIVYGGKITTLDCVITMLNDHIQVQAANGMTLILLDSNLFNGDFEFEVVE